MTYGQNRQQVTSDTFGAAIDSDWEVGSDNHQGYTWVTGGLIEPDNLSQTGRMRHGGGSHSFDGDQYSQCTWGVNMGTDTVAGPVVRQQSQNDETGYEGWWHSFSNRWEIVVGNGSGGSASLQTYSTGWTAPSSGTVGTLEAEGSTIRFGDDQGGLDTERVNTTDNTVTGGVPGLRGYTSNSLASARFTAWAGGNIKPPATGTGAQSLPSLSQAGSGGQTFDGSGAQALAALRQSGSGAVAQDGSGAQILPAVLQVGAGIQVFTSIADQLLPALVQNGAGMGGVAAPFADLIIVDRVATLLSLSDRAETAATASDRAETLLSIGDRRCA